MASGIIVLDLIKAAMRQAGILATGETPSADMAQDALLVVNDLLENWSTERLSVWGAANETFNTVAGQATYTVGQGANFNTTRPVSIDGAYVNFSGVDFPLTSITQQEYNDISLKTMRQPIAERFLYVNDFPNGLLTIWPVPTAAVPITLTTARILASNVTLTTALTGPPGFTKAFRLCLAVELCPEFGQTASTELVQVMADARSDYKNSNRVDVVAYHDPAVVGLGFVHWQMGY